MDERKARELEQQADKLLKPYMDRQGGGYILSPRELRRRSQIERPQPDMDIYGGEDCHKIA